MLSRAPRIPNRRRLLAAALVLGLAGLTGCGTPYQRPAAPVAGSWPDSGYRGGEQTPRELAWRDFFQDPQLRGLIERGLRHNRDLALALARIEEARAAYGLSNAERRPNTAIYGQMAKEAVSQSIAGGADGVNAQRFDLRLNLLSYEVDFWGRLASLSDAAKARLAGSEAGARVVRATVITEIANAYFTRLDLIERINLLRETIAGRERGSELLQQAFEQGAVSKLEVLQAEGQVQTARNELAAMQTQLATVGNYLTLLTGHGEGDLPPGWSLASQRLEAAFAVGIPSDVLLKRPDVMAAEQRLIEAHANVDAARALFFPRILLTAGAGFASLALGQLLGPAGKGAWSFAPSITMPLFDGGRTAGGVDLAHIRENLAVADYERTIQTAFREVADLLAAHGGIAAQRQAAASAWVIQQQRALATEARFRAGAISYMEVLDAFREELTAAQQLSTLRRAELANATLLYKALGGGEAAADG